MNRRTFVYLFISLTMVALVFGSLPFAAAETSNAPVGMTETPCRTRPSEHACAEHAVPNTPVPNTPVPNTPVPNTPVPNTPVPKHARAEHACAEHACAEHARAEHACACRTRPSRRQQTRRPRRQSLGCPTPAVLRHRAELLPGSWCWSLRSSAASALWRLA